MNTENVNGLLPVSLIGVVLDCKDVFALSDFYIRLLGWEETYSEDDEWAVISSPSGGVNIAFQKNDDYVSPVWPEKSGAQQQMIHLDFAVQDAEKKDLAVNHAISCGATKSPVQYSDEWVVMYDPAGHPFCFVVG